MAVTIQVHTFVFAEDSGFRGNVSLLDLASSVICLSFLHLSFLFSENCIGPACCAQHGIKAAWEHHPCSQPVSLPHAANIPS